MVGWGLSSALLNAAADQMLWLGSAQYTQAVAKAHTRMADGLDFLGQSRPYSCWAQSGRCDGAAAARSAPPSGAWPQNSVPEFKPGREICLLSPD